MNMPFDPSTFLQESQASGFETKFTQVEVGEYPAIIDKIAYRTLPKKDSPGEESHIIDVTYAIDDARQKEITGMDRPTVRQSIFLDLASGKLDRSKNKNLNLGRLLTALGFQSDDGKETREWSFNDLVGRPCMVKIEESPNPKTPSDPYRNVTKVGKLGA